MEVINPFDLPTSDSLHTIALDVDDNDGDHDMHMQGGDSFCDVTQTRTLLRV